MTDITLLNIFESKVRNNIITFCKELSASKADLYVVMARKAACFVSVLEKIKLMSLNGDVISERVLDSNIDWSHYKDIIIIDDVVISGTTLYHTIHTIKNARPDAKIKLYVLGVNSDWYNSDVLEDNGVSYIQEPIRCMNNSECIRLSGDIVRMLSRYPVPYNIDFPIYNTLRLNKNSFRQLVTLPGWKISEVSSFSNSNPNIFTHTFQPRQETLEYLGQFFCSDFMRHALLKIRTYGRRRTDKQREYNLITIVPMVIMPPMDVNTLEALFKEIAGSRYDRLYETLTSTTSKLRFVQFVLSDVLARLFLNMINYLLGESDQVQREYNSLRYLFPSSIISVINEVADNFIGNIKKAIPITKSQESVEENTIKELLDVNHVLTSPFINMYYQQEICSRQLVRQYGKSVFDREEYKIAIGRLDRGVSLTYLLQVLSDIPQSLKLSFVSAFLDRAIDEGIVVPITVTEGELVYRAFRHGEDVQFGQQEERLCYDMLSAFSASVGREDLPRLWVEKLLVLLFQLGEGEIFVPIQTNLSSFSNIGGSLKVDTAGVRYYLQGPLIVRTPTEAIFNKPYLEYNDKALWLSTYFSKNDISPLKETENKKYVFSNDKYRQVSEGDNQIVVDSKKTQFAKSIGRLFGQLLANESNGKTPSINSDILVTLTSSLDTKSVIGAMAAEINICANSFLSDSPAGVRATFTAIINGQVLPEEGFERIKKSAWHQALNDGIRKFQWYREKRGYEIINTVSQQWQDELYKDTWDGIWSPNLENFGNQERSEVIDQAIVEGLWLLCVNAYFLMFNYLKMKDVDSSYNSQELMNRIDGIYQIIKTYANHRRVKEIIPLLIEFKNKHHEPSYVQKHIPEIYYRLSTMFNLSGRILSDTRTYFSNSLKLPIYQNYHHALYIEVSDNTGWEILKHFYESFRYKMQNCGKELTTEVLMVPSEDLIFSGHYYSMLISYNEDGLIWLLEAAADFIQKTYGMAEHKIFLLPHLPVECHIKVSENGQYQYQLFKSFLVNIIDSIQSVRFGNDCIYEMLEDGYHKGVNQMHPFFQVFASAYAEEKEIYIPNKRKYNVTRFEKMEQPLVMKADIGIITIVDEEARAVRKGFNMVDEKAVLFDNRYYDSEIFQVNGKDFTIVHTQCPLQGNISMAIAVTEFVKHYNPTLLVLLGIAGSIQEKIDLCDVVIANDVLYYESRKEKSDGNIEHRLRHFNMAFDMKSHITRYRSICTDDFKAAEGSKNKTFKLHVTPIGTGEAVVANKLSAIRDWLLSVNSKTGVVETEAAGFSAAFEESTSSISQILIIRGISDKADADKDNNWRQAASDNAVTVLKDFIGRIFSRLS